MDFQKSQTRYSITTSNRDIDILIGGPGLELGKVTEFCGVSGTGKTQMGLQLACDVQLPHQLGGVAGQCIYIDTANGMVGHRLQNVAKGFVQHIHRMARKRSMVTGNESLWNEIQSQLPSEKEMMSNILLFRVFEFSDLDHVLMTLLEEILSGDSKHYSSKFHRVKLIVIDSISFLIKYQSDIAKYVLKCGQLFHFLCKKYNVSIVCMNQMTTKMSVGYRDYPRNKKKRDFYDDEYGDFDQMPVDSKYVIVPGLGHIWTSVVNVRMQLMMIEETRCAKLMKTNCSVKSGQIATFKISNGGIRNIKTQRNH